MANPLITVKDIEAAAERLRPYINRTPLLQSLVLDEGASGKVRCKAECLQQTGSFKLRGALNAILQFREQGVEEIVAYSSGNHAQGVALAARLARVKATIVMPEDAPRVKLERTQRDGADLVLYDRYKESREDIAREIADSRKAQLLPPFDHPFIIAGQGTVGLEIAEDLSQSGRAVDQVLVGASGGGLAAGISIAIEAHYPDAELILVEPEGYDDFRQSFAAGKRLITTPARPSICDALLSPFPGELTFPILQGRGAQAITVSDDAVLQAIKFAARELKVIVEPGGAIALAAVLTGAVRTKDRTTLAVLSGGNIDQAMFDRAMAMP